MVRSVLRAIEFLCEAMAPACPSFPTAPNNFVITTAVTRCVRSDCPITGNFLPKYLFNRFFPQSVLSTTLVLSNLVLVSFQPRLIDIWTMVDIWFRIGRNSLPPP